MINFTSSIWSLALEIGDLFSTYKISPVYGFKSGPSMALELAVVAPPEIVNASLA